MKADIQLIEIEGTAIAIATADSSDYFSLTDLASAYQSGSPLIMDWLRNLRTIDFLAAWEQAYNPKFNYGEFAIIRNAAGSNRFKLSVKQWIERTRAIGIRAMSGKHGGTYAHEDIALEFATWLSPIFKLKLIWEFKRLKAAEASRNSEQWTVARLLAKMNQSVMAESIKHCILPNTSRPPALHWTAYANENELINQIVFGITAKEWNHQHPNRPSLRDAATVEQLQLLANLESHNSLLIEEGLSRVQRKPLLEQMAGIQKRRLGTIANRKVVAPNIIP